MTQCSLLLTVLGLAGWCAVPPCFAGEGFEPRLLQAELDATAVAAGERLNVAYWWTNSGTAPASGDERVLVHVRRPGEAEDRPDAVRVSGDHEPLIPTYRWFPGRVVAYRSAIQIPASTPPGEYLLLVGLFDREGRHKLDVPGVPEENGRHVLAHFQVTPAHQSPARTPLKLSFEPLPAAPVASQGSPAQTVTVGDGPLHLLLDALAPRIVSWQLGGSSLSGDADDPLVDLLDTATNRVIPADTAPLQLQWIPERVGARRIYHARVMAGTHPAVTFDVTFALEQTRAEFSVDNIIEFPGYQLVSVRLPRLVSARGARARLAVPNQAGRLIRPLAGPAQQLVTGLDWNNPLLAGVVYDERLLCAASVDGIDHRFLATAGEDWTALGAGLEFRSPAEAGVPSLRLASNARVTLRFAAPAGRAPEWIDGARLLREGVTARPPSIYRDTVLYKIFCDLPGANHFTTFAQALDLVRRYHDLIDGAPQVVYLVGWQHEGHDTGYPDVFAVDTRLGGAAALTEAMAGAERLNATLSFHDNYDDAYLASPGFDLDLIARDRTNSLMKGGVWAGGQSYLIAVAKYARGAAQRRIQRTLESYPIRLSYHLDVLSSAPPRHDYNPADPASGAQSTTGKIAIVQEFNRHGVDVTSEGFTSPYVGVIGHAWHLLRGQERYFAGESRIPFVPFVYHGHATWGGAKSTTADIPEALLYGATFSADFDRATPDRELTNSYYLLTVPHLLLRGREMTNYRDTGGVRRVEYGADTSVTVDDRGPHYEVIVDGRLVARDFTTFAPNWRSDAWLAYRRDAGPALDFPAPAGWTDPTRIHAVTLTANGPGVPVPVQLAGDRLQITAPTATPVRVRYR